MTALFFLLGVTFSADSPAWITSNPYRVSVLVDSAGSREVNSPVGVAIDFRTLFRDAKLPGRLDPDSIRVVRFDPSTGNPLQNGNAGASSFEIPYQTTGDFPNDDAGMIWWRRQDSDARHFHIYFDSLAHGKHDPPEVLGLVGIGDMFHYNDGKPGPAHATPLHSQFWHVDFDGDQLRDLIGFAYGQFEFNGQRPPSPDNSDTNWWRQLNLGNAIYFLRNIGTANQPLFAPRYRLKADDGRYLRTDLLPQNMTPADWDGDGDLDFFGIGIRDALLVWENTGRRDRNGLWILKQARTITHLDQISSFREQLPALVSRPSSFRFRGVRRVDWDADGDWDLLACLQRTNRLWAVNPRQGIIPYGANLEIFELFENIAGRGAAMAEYARPVVIYEERGLPLNAFSVSTGGAEYVDWDQDGDQDLLFHDRTSRPLAGGRLMFAENRGTRAEPIFSMPIPVQQATDSPFAVDWNDDGRLDVVAGMEFFENVNPAVRSGSEHRAPRNRAGSRTPDADRFPRLVSRGFAQQIHPQIISYFGVSVDWDGDGVLDMIRGHHSHVLLFRNKGTVLNPIFERGRKLLAGGKPIYMPNWLDLTTDPASHFGPQGPSEPRHGWLNPAVGDWDSDGDLDLFVTGQRWQTMYFENVGTPTRPTLAPGREVRCAGDRFEFSWRSKVSVGDIDGDDVMELVVTSNQDRVFYAYEQSAGEPEQSRRADQARSLNVSRGEPLRLEDGQPIKGWYGSQNNNGDNHSLLVDWDHDGDLDLINGSLFAVWYYENTGGRATPRFRAHGRIRAGGQPLHTFNHAGSIDAADWNDDGRLDLVLSTECPSDQPHGAPLHLLDRAFLENELPAATLGTVQQR